MRPSGSQAAGHPEYPWLYTVRGYRFCDLLLSPIERIAWAQTLRLPVSNIQRSPRYARLWRMSAGEAVRALPCSGKWVGYWTAASTTLRWVGLSFSNRYLCRSQKRIQPETPPDTRSRPPRTVFAPPAIFSTYPAGLLAGPG